VSFAVLGFTGVRIYLKAPPIPEHVLDEAGNEVFPAGSVSAGQNVWQSLGGMQMGSIWGHGSYVAPDWTADWLHREAVFILDDWGQAQHGKRYAELPVEDQGALRERLTALLRANGYDPARDALSLPAVRANLAHYADVLGNGRPEYAIPARTLTNEARQMHDPAPSARIEHGAHLSRQLVRRDRLLQIRNLAVQRSVSNQGIVRVS
jgi:nitric oxide reductase subunit B